MGVILAATDAMNWLASITGSTPAQLDAALEGSTATPTDVLFLPYLGGERTPINDANARGVFVGLNHSTDTVQMTRAVMQGVAFAFRDSQMALQDAGTSLSRATAIGGGAKSAYWLQVLANALQLPLDVASDGDFGASLGAARLGLIAANKANALDVCTPPPVSSCVEPDAKTAQAFTEQHTRYKAVYSALKSTMAG